MDGVQILDHRRCTQLTIAHTRGRKLVMGVTGFPPPRFRDVVAEVTAEVRGLPGAVVVLQAGSVTGWAQV